MMNDGGTEVCRIGTGTGNGSASRNATERPSPSSSLLVSSSAGHSAWCMAELENCVCVCVCVSFVIDKRLLLHGCRRVVPARAWHTRTRMDDQSWLLPC